VSEDTRDLETWKGFIASGIAGLIVHCLPDERDENKLDGDGPYPFLPPGMRETPDRVVRAFEEMTSGYRTRAEDVLGAVFDGKQYDEIVALTGIPFHSLCEHHLLPFHGVAHVAYIPVEARVVGLSKLARLVEMHARRFQLQERMTADVAADLMRVLSPLGVAVMIRARHSCMEARGVRKSQATMTTSVLLGVFREKPEARAEVLALFRDGKA
jgi:GTP cyclohydrolase I